MPDGVSLANLLCARWSAQNYFAGVAGVAETDLVVDFLLVFFALVGLAEAAVPVVAVLDDAVLAGAGFVAGAVLCAIRETPANARVIVAPRIVEIVFFILVGVLCRKRFYLFFASDSIDEAIMNQA